MSTAGAAGLSKGLRAFLPHYTHFLGVSRLLGYGGRLREGARGALQVIREPMVKQEAQRVLIAAGRQRFKLVQHWKVALPPCSTGGKTQE